MEALIFTLLSAVSGAIASAFPSYYLGKTENGDQVLHEQRVESPTEVRQMLLTIRDSFIKATNPAAYRLPDEPSRLQQAREVTRALDELRGYYRAKKPFLEAKTIAVINLLLQTFTDKQMKYQIYLEVNANDELRELDPDAPYPEDEIAEDFHEWAFATGKDAARDTGRDRYSGRYLSEYFARFVYLEAPCTGRMHRKARNGEVLEDNR